MAAVDLPAVHAAAIANTRRIIGSADLDPLDRPTPCEGWDVATLLRHVVAGNLWVTPLVVGESIEDVGDRFDGDVLGHDPIAAYRWSGEAASAAFSAPGAMDAPCVVSYGPVPGSVYCGHRFIDVLVHGWDLAIALGGDAELPADLVDACTIVLLPQVEMIAGSGAYGTSTDLGTTVDPQTRLLALLGRRQPA